MIPALVVAVIAVIALFFVLTPLLRGPRAEVEPRTARIEEAEGKKRAALLALADLENEREVGKLSASDFELLRAEYEREALEALKELDAVGTVFDDGELEAEIAAMKTRLQCANCGALMTPGQPCPSCNTAT